MYGKEAVVRSFSSTAGPSAPRNSNIRSGPSARDMMLLLSITVSRRITESVYGLRISRLSKDLYELLTELDLNNVAVLGHSMGSSVIWCYIDLFGPERLSKIILVDQMPLVTSDPHWTQPELEDSGANLTAQQVFDIVAALRSKEAEQVTRQVIDGHVTKHATRQMREWVVQCNLKMPRDFAATLLYNHAHVDWRDFIPRINLPTLIISGRASAIPWKSQEWIHRQIKDSQFEVFESSACLPPQLWWRELPLAERTGLLSS